MLSGGLGVVYLPTLTWIERAVHGTPLDPKFFVCGRFRKTAIPEA